MRHICLYIGAKIFSAGVHTGSQEVVQEALADLKKGGGSKAIWKYYKKSSDLVAGPFPKLFFSFKVKLHAREVKKLTRTTRSNSTMVTPTSNRPKTSKNIL